MKRNNGKTGNVRALLRETPVTRMRALAIINATDSDDAVEGYIYTIYASEDDKETQNHPQAFLFTMEDADGEFEYRMDVQEHTFQAEEDAILEFLRGISGFWSARGVQILPDDRGAFSVVEPNQCNFHIFIEDAFADCTENEYRLMYLFD